MVSYQFKLEGCFAAKDGKYTKSLFFVLLDSFNLHVRAVAEHEFYPQGLTIVAVLAESDARMHTWPEKDIIDIDIFHCGDGRMLHIDALLDTIELLFKSHNITYVVTDRNTMSVIIQGTKYRT
jgi:S-adenosylmethionine/arginine decarboxylase-like enzyme